MPLLPVAVPCFPDSREVQSPDILAKDILATDESPEDMTVEDIAPQENWPKAAQSPEVDGDLNSQGWFVALAAQVRARGGCWQGALLDLMMDDPLDTPEPANSPEAAAIESLPPGLHLVSRARPAPVPALARGRSGRRPRVRPQFR